MFVTLVVAVEDLRAGAPVLAGQIAVEPTEVFPFGPCAARNPELVIGRVPRRRIRAGTVILPGMLAAGKEVERGDTVSVDVRSGSARLRFEARAETSGASGDSVKVRNPASGRIFAAVVAGKERVIVDADPEAGGSARSSGRDRARGSGR
jgi:flagella basal body P-ring formation protein FlgA